LLGREVVELACFTFADIHCVFGITSRRPGRQAPGGMGGTSAERSGADSSTVGSSLQNVLAFSFMCANSGKFENDCIVEHVVISTIF